MNKKYRLSDRSYFWMAAIVYGAILFAFMAILISRGDSWVKYDAGRFYEMAGVILNGGTPYVDFMDPKPPLIFFTLVPIAYFHAQLEGGYLLAALCNLANTLILLKIGWRLYGRLPGFMAGLLFVANLPFIEGPFLFTEPFALLFLLASAYVLLFWKTGHRYLFAGLCAGVAIGYKQYALLAIPLTLLLLYLKSELRGFVPFMAGLLLVVVAIFGAFYLAYGFSACQSALYWSFGVAGDYIARADLGDGVMAWKPTNSVEIAGNLLLVTVALSSLLAFSLAGFARCRGKAEYFFFASGLAYAGTILIRPYFHYLVLALPFLALLCAGAFRDHGREAYAPDENSVRFK